MRLPFYGFDSERRRTSPKAVLPVGRKTVPFIICLLAESITRSVLLILFKNRERLYLEATKVRATGRSQNQGE